jgi:N-acetylmuramoyl-L-alanine amidase
MTGPTTYEVFLPGTKLSPAVTPEFVGDSLVTDIFPAAADSGVTVRVGLHRTTTPLGFSLTATDGIPDRIVVDVPVPQGSDDATQRGSRATETKPLKGYVVAIDAGHGGDDPGALGFRRLQEADVVLSIARKIKAELDAVPNVSAILTRSGDYFIPLRKRIQLARTSGADLFVSVHCNASRNHDATGTEVYFLSLTGATDEAARSLAEAENAADLVGGVPPESGDDLLSILFDLRQNDTVRRSSELAENLVDALREEDRLTTRGVKQAGFVVLKAPEMPAVLVETAFITNPREASLLKDPQFQVKFAERLADGIEAYVRTHAKTAPT